MPVDPLYSELAFPEQKSSGSVTAPLQNEQVSSSKDVKHAQPVGSDDDGSYSEDYKAEVSPSSGLLQNKRSSQKRSTLWMGRTMHRQSSSFPQLFDSIDE